MSLRGRSGRNRYSVMSSWLSISYLTKCKVLREERANATVPEGAGFDTVGAGRMRETAGLKRARDRAPNTESGTVVALPNCEGTQQERDQPRREYLTEKEVNQLCDAARARGRWGHRDATMIL